MKIVPTTTTTLTVPWSGLRRRQKISFFTLCGKFITQALASPSPSAASLRTGWPWSSPTRQRYPGWKSTTRWWNAVLQIYFLEKKHDLSVLGRRAQESGRSPKVHLHNLYQKVLSIRIYFCDFFPPAKFSSADSMPRLVYLRPTREMGQGRSEEIYQICSEKDVLVCILYIFLKKCSCRELRN